MLLAVPSFLMTLTLTCLATAQPQPAVPAPSTNDASTSGVQPRRPNLAPDDEAFFKSHSPQRQQVSKHSFWVISLAPSDQRIDSDLLGRLNLSEVLVLGSNNLFLRGQAIRFFPSEFAFVVEPIVTSRYGMAYYASPVDGFWLWDPENKETKGFVNTFTKPVNHSIGNVSQTHMWGLLADDWVRYYGAKGWNRASVTEELLFIGSQLRIALTQANGDVISSIPHPASFYVLGGGNSWRLGTVYVTGQFVTLGTDKIPVNVAELGGVIFVGRATDLVDVDTFLTDPKHRSLAAELLQQAVKGNMLFAAEVVWTVGSRSRDKLPADLQGLMQQLGPPPVQSTRGWWRVTVENGKHRILPFE